MSGFQTSVTTRSKAAAAAAAAARHPQAESAFREGLQSVFRQWTALELAIFHQWGGPSSAERVEQLVAELMDMFLGPEKIYKDDVSLVLEDYMETHFNTMCDDGSPDEIGELLALMWRQCCTGNFELVSTTLGREFVRHETILKCQGVEASGDVLDSDDEDGMAGIPEDIGAELTEATAEAVAADAAATEAETDGEATMTVDPDGWETVVRGTKAKGKGSKKR